MTYPLRPLLEWMGTADNVSRVRLAVSGSSWRRYRTEGLSPDVAVRLADRAGVHPAEVWPSWYDDELERFGKVCAADGCDVVFFPKTSRRIYCSRRCRDRRYRAEWARQKYRSDPEFRRKQREKAAARYAVERDYVLAQRRRSRPRESA